LLPWLFVLASWPFVFVVSCRPVWCCSGPFIVFFAYMYNVCIIVLMNKILMFKKKKWIFFVRKWDYKTITHTITMYRVPIVWSLNK
jgi:hypothetical protein